MDDHGINVRNVQPRLDDGGRHQHVDVAVDKIVHDALQLALLHLAVSERYICLRQQLCDFICHLHDSIDTVIDIVNLPAPRQLAADRFAHHFFIILHNIGLDSGPLHRRLLQHAHITDTDQAHMQRARDRRRCEREYIHICL